ncbi:MAG: aromatic ring-hydroxylating oxygenase subunit alpha [Acidobacteriota bacterium]
MANEFVFDQRLELATTLPSRWYIDPKLYDLERERIFSRTWQMAGRTAQVAEPGDYFTTNIAQEPVVVVRDAGGKLRAFSNVCRHRAGPVAQGEGHCRLFKCGYHGWTYALDGRLLGTPEFGGAECFAREAGDLPEFSVDTWGPLVFVNLDRRCAPLAEILQDLPERIGGLQWNSMQPAERKDWFVDCNWKVYVDNYLEGYHIPTVHPSLARELDYSRYRTETQRYYSVQHSPIRADSSRIAQQEGQAESRAQYFWIFPNLMLNLYPDNFSTNLILPLGPDRTQTVFEWFFLDPESESTRQAVRRTVQFSDEIQIEDIGICEIVQRGLRSSTYDTGRYSVKRENGVHHFHGLLAEFLK